MAGDGKRGEELNKETQEHMAHKYVTSRASTLALAPNWARSINAKIIVSSCQIERAGAGNNKYCIIGKKEKKISEGKKKQT